MSTVMRKSFANPDEVRAPDKAKVSVCDLGGIAAAKQVGTVISGQIAAKHNDGTEQVFGPGDVYVIEPDHNGWVKGDEEVVAFEFNSTAAQTYAKTD